MGKFNEYTQKATPEDADSLMIYDATSKRRQTSFRRSAEFGTGLLGN